MMNLNPTTDRRGINNNLYFNQKGTGNMCCEEQGVVVTSFSKVFEVKTCFTIWN